MLKDDWKARPKIDDILQKSLPALAPQSPTISMFVPSLVAEIYDFLAGFYSWYVTLCGKVLIVFLVRIHAY